MDVSKLNNRINCIHERALRVVYKDYKTPFHELLLKDNSLTIHQRNLQKLAIEIFKVIEGTSPELMKTVFKIENCRYNLRNQTKFKTRNINTTRYGTETIANIGPKIWNLVPTNIKESNTVSEFKAKIKQWIPVNCPCRLCKTYIQNVVFI